MENVSVLQKQNETILYQLLPDMLRVLIIMFMLYIDSLRFENYHKSFYSTLLALYSKAIQSLCL